MILKHHNNNETHQNNEVSCGELKLFSFGVWPMHTKLISKEILVVSWKSTSHLENLCQILLRQDCRGEAFADTERHSFRVPGR